MLCWGTKLTITRNVRCDIDEALLTDSISLFDRQWLEEFPFLFLHKVSYEEAQEVIDSEMKRRGLDYVFYETSALTGYNLEEFSKIFGMCMPCTVQEHAWLWLASHRWTCAIGLFSLEMSCTANIVTLIYHFRISQWDLANTVEVVAS